MRPFVCNQVAHNTTASVSRRLHFPSCVLVYVWFGLSHGIKRAVLRLRYPARLVPRDARVGCQGCCSSNYFLSAFLHQLRNQASHQTPKYHILYQPPQGNALFILDRAMRALGWCVAQSVSSHNRADEVTPRSGVHCACLVFERAHFLRVLFLFESPASLCPLSHPPSPCRTCCRFGLRLFFLVLINKHKRSRRLPQAHSILYFSHLSCLIHLSMTLIARSEGVGNSWSCRLQRNQY